MAIKSPIRPQAEIEWQLLRLLQSGRPIPTQDAYNALADIFKLSLEERRALIGVETYENAWENECRFAKRHLVDQGYVISQSRGVWAITPKGLDAVKNRGAKYSSLSRTAEDLGL